MDTKLRNEVAVILGCLETGAPILQNENVRRTLQRVIKQWLLYAKSDARTLSSLDRAWDSLGTTLQRDLFHIMLSAQTVSYASLEAAWKDGAQESNTIESRLKELRKKLDRTEWDFSIRRSSQEISWKVRAGRKM